MTLCGTPSQFRPLAPTIDDTDVDKLKKASAEEIAAIEGVGPKLAENIVSFFSQLKTREPLRALEAQNRKAALHLPEPADE